MFTVYAVREKNTRGVYKIGHSSNVRQRVYNLSTGNWRGIELAMVLGTYETKAEAERAEELVHNLLCDSHINGEWYEVNLRQLSEFRAMLASV